MQHCFNPLIILSAHSNIQGNGYQKRYLLIRQSWRPLALINKSQSNDPAVKACSAE